MNRIKLLLISLTVIVFSTAFDIVHAQQILPDPNPPGNVIFVTGDEENNDNDFMALR